jgi:cellulose synthase/poly-beta-1,6-N-acetylglucosamine synthase-like glycosyltransferase
MNAMDLVRIAQAAHVILMISLGVYCILAGAPIWTVFQYIFLHKKGLRAEQAVLSAPMARDQALPTVLIQLPTFNEGALVKRICEAIAALDWPANRLKVQILDDSTDGGEIEAEQAAAALRAQGIDARLQRRLDRRGFKAGALAEGLALSKDPFVAIFDTDYIPRPDFLRNVMRPLIADDGLAFVQARCDYLNSEENNLTRIQTRLLDAHYAIEQPARGWSGQIVPFNGTCGVWRRSAINDVGGWQGDTLAEDMDLSFRAQMKGWRAMFLATVTVPGELPNTFKAWRRQQFRWIKGSAEVTNKLLASLWKSNLTLPQKFASTLYFGGGIFRFLLGVSLVSGVVEWAAAGRLFPSTIMLLVFLAAENFGGSAMLQVAGQRYARRRGLAGEIGWALAVMVFHLGVSLTNLGAGLEALLGWGTAFERTPKGGIAAEPSQ